MNIERVTLSNFRNFKDEGVNFIGGVNVFEGLNAQGKTNLLEGVYYCATGRSFRTYYQKSLIMENEEEARVCASITRNGKGAGKIEAVVGKNGKEFFIDGIKADKLGDLFGALHCVSFCPEDLSLVKAGPDVKRSFMDLELCQLDKVYYYELKAYYKSLKHRNALLKSLATGEAGRDAAVEIEPWDIELAKYGEKVIKTRAEFISKLSVMAAEEYNRLSGEAMSIKYKSNCRAGEILVCLKNSLGRDLLMGSTSRGIHKDDIFITVNGRDARVYASQGQARSAAVSIKLAQMNMFRLISNEEPVMLFDDVFSELDSVRQRRLIESLGGAQTIITCTGAEAVLSTLCELKREGGVKRFVVEAGKIRESGD